jgi:crossover junction endodeoxyribonuclease RusA
MILTLPWPPRILSPNNRSHWAKKSPVRAKYRADCTYAALAAGVPVLPPEGKIKLLLTFCPPDERKRDDDNFISAFKSGRDGLADAWRIDDNRFRITVETGDVVKHGCVKVQVL